MFVLKTRPAIFWICFTAVTVSFLGCVQRRNASNEVDNPILAVGKAHEPIHIPDPKADWIVLETSHYIDLAEK